MTSPIAALDLDAMERAYTSVSQDGKPTDVYRVEASKIFNVPEDQVTPEQRRYVKKQAFIRIYSGKEN